MYHMLSVMHWCEFMRKTKARQLHDLHYSRFHSIDLSIHFTPHWFEVSIRIYRFWVCSDSNFPVGGIVHRGGERIGFGIFVNWGSTKMVTFSGLAPHKLWRSVLLPQYRTPIPLLVLLLQMEQFRKFLRSPIVIISDWPLTLLARCMQGDDFMWNDEEGSSGNESINQINTFWFTSLLR